MFPTLGNSLDTLFLIQDTRQRRVSSYARDGSNHDWIDVIAGTTYSTELLSGPGIVRHVWCTIGSEDPDILRHVIIRFFWDGEQTPSVQAPIGDFFGLVFGRRVEFSSLPLIAAPNGGRGMVSYFPMPFFESARMEVENRSELPIMLYFYLDWDDYRNSRQAASLFDRGVDGLGLFHAQFCQQTPTDGNPKITKASWDKKSSSAGKEQPAWWPEHWDDSNLDGAGNYVILDAAGRGHYVGCVLGVDNFSEQSNDWYGEGDDMIFVDGEPWPPELHGTGTEDYFNTAFGPKSVFNTPFFGITAYNGDKVGRPWGGKNTMYRFHIPDPIRFQSSIRVTIEHGHNNVLTNDYASVAYWYQTEPHATFADLPDKAALVPRPDA